MGGTCLSRRCRAAASLVAGRVHCALLCLVHGRAVVSGADVQGSVQDASAAVQVAPRNVFGLPLFTQQRLALATLAAGDYQVTHWFFDADHGRLRCPSDLNALLLRCTRCKNVNPPCLKHASEARYH